ncbi:MAG: carbon-nitrogen hydrolase family protein [Desulfurococcales archaeon]|nr:carbon-nitrogen hydrolase family protein [Desulfurococcales archaeon]
MRLALLQPGSSGVEEFIDSIPRVDLLILPENWASSRPLDAEEYIQQALDLARRVNAHVLAGTQYVRPKSGAKPVSLGVLVSPRGEVRVACEKLFPSGSVGERGLLERGRLADVLEVGGVRVACIACVDIYYPEVARYYSLRGAQVLVNPASIPANRVHSWGSVLSARASENSVYVIGVNKVGTPYPDGRLTGGYSSIYTPEGEFYAGLGPYPALLTAEIDPDLISKVRSRRMFIADAAKLDSEGFYSWRILDEVEL